MVSGACISVSDRFVDTLIAAARQVVEMLDNAVEPSRFVDVGPLAQKSASELLN
jgi:hypothetical protein